MSKGDEVIPLAIEPPPPSLVGENRGRTNEIVVPPDRADPLKFHLSRRDFTIGVPTLGLQQGGTERGTICLGDICLRERAVMIRGTLRGGSVLSCC